MVVLQFPNSADFAKVFEEIGAGLIIYFDAKDSKEQDQLKIQLSTKTFVHKYCLAIYKLHFVCEPFERMKDLEK